MNNDDYIRMGYLDRRVGSGSKYNYDLYPLIKNFSFHQFIYDGRKNSEYLSDYGGFLVITDKQYIIGYNAGFGVGTHIASFARVIKELKGGGTILNDAEALKLSRACKDSYIVAHIVYEQISINPIRYKGYLSFQFKGNRISEGTFLVFKKFYEDYSTEIKCISSKYGKDVFKVTFPYNDTDENKKIVTDDLDELYKYLESHIDYSIEPSQSDEVIIGTEVKNKNKK